VIEIVSEAMKHVVEAISPEVKRVENLPQDVQLPLEDVQLAGEIWFDTRGDGYR
jgi:hypothetical protein